MGRIRKFYEQEFARLLGRVGAANSAGVARQFEIASECARLEGMSSAAALAFHHAELRRCSGETRDYPDRFLCDGGAGGLARWLRAAGYEADWLPDGHDATVIREAQRLGSTLVTTDTMMMERGVLRDGQVPAVCLPPALCLADQLAVVLVQLDLPLREPRCMSCGGELRPTEKGAIKERIPPRTALWLDTYFVCDECGKLFWRGTHWQRIAGALHGLKGRVRNNSGEGQVGRDEP